MIPTFDLPHLWNLWQTLPTKEQISAFVPVAAMITALIAILGSAWQFRSVKSKEIAFRLQEQRKEKYEALMQLMVAVLTTTGEFPNTTQEGGGVGFLGTTGVKRDEWMRASIDLGLYASDEFFKKYNVYMTGLIRNDDSGASARRMGEVFLQIRKDVGLVNTNLTARELLSTFITDIRDERYDEVFKGKLCQEPRPSRPAPLIGEDERKLIDVYLAEVKSVETAVNKWRSELFGEESQNRMSEWNVPDEDHKDQRLELIETCLTDLLAARKVLQSVTVPVQTQRLQQHYVSLVDLFIEAAQLTERALSEGSSLALSVALLRWLKGAADVQQMLQVNEVLSARVPSKVADELLTQLATTSSQNGPLEAAPEGGVQADQSSASGGADSQGLSRQQRRALERSDKKS